MAKQVFEPRTDETVFARKVSADCWKSPKQALSRQIAGKTYFTDQRIAFLASGLIGTESVSWEIDERYPVGQSLSDAAIFPFRRSDHDERRQPV